MRLEQRPERSEWPGPVALCSDDLYDDPGAGVSDVTCPVPERRKTGRDVAIDRAGDRQGACGVGVPAADGGETGQGALVFTVAASPRVDQRRCWQQIAFVVIARTVGQHEVLHGVDATADRGMKWPASGARWSGLRR